MDPKVGELLKGPILLAERIRKAVEETDSFKLECYDLSKQVEKLAQLLRQAARVSTYAARGLYLNPCKRITEDMEKTLYKVLALVRKCKRCGILKRLFTITSVTDFRKLSYLLDSAIGDMTWFLTVSALGVASSAFSGLPPIAANDPILALIWEQIAHVQAGSAEEKSEAAADLARLAGDNDRNGKIIIEEGGLPPLLKLLTEGTPFGQEMAAMALGVLASDQHRVQEIMKAGAVEPFLQIVIEAPMKVQIQTVATMAKMVSNDHETQNAFGAATRPLVALLAYDTIEEPPATVRKALDMQTLVRASIAENKIGNHVEETSAPENKDTSESSPNHSRTTDQKSQSSWLQKRPGPLILDGATMRDEKADQWPVQTPLISSGSKIESIFTIPFSKQSHFDRIDSESFMTFENTRPFAGPTLRSLNRKERDQEDPQTKMELKANVALALWRLAENNIKNSKSITETRAIRCFAKLIEHGEEKVQRNSIMAVMEIAAAAEKDQQLRKSSFKTTSSAVKALVEQLLQVMEGGTEMHVYAIRTIGYLARMFPSKETRVVKSLTAQLAHSNLVVASEAATALQKFTTPDNFLHVAHSKTILEATGASFIVKLATFGGDQAQIPALILLCYISLHVGDDDGLKKAKALQALESSSRLAPIMQTPPLPKLIPLAIENLKLYQPVAHQENGFH